MKSMGRIGLCALLTLGLSIGVPNVAGAHQRTTKKVKHQKVSILMLGDSVALTLGWDLGHPDLTAQYDYSFADFGIVGCGVVMGRAIRADGKSTLSEPQCNGFTPAPGTPLVKQPWPVQWKAELAKYHPNVVVLLAGRWEEVDRVYDGEWTNILDPTFAAYVKQQLELASLLVTSTGANLEFMTAPCDDAETALDGAPWPENDPARLAEYNTLVREVAAEFPTTDSVYDLDALVCPGGKYRSTYEGETIRNSDGVHFALTAGITLAPEIIPPILAAGRAQIARIDKQTVK
jgi:hypothetical protein